MYQTTQTQNFEFDFLTSWPWMTLNWHKLLKYLGESLKLSQTQSKTFHLLYFNLIRLLCRRSEQLQIFKDLTFDPACDVISDVQIKMFHHIRKYQAQAIKCCFRIEHWSIGLADSRAGVGGKTFPHRRGPSIPHRAFTPCRSTYGVAHTSYVCDYELFARLGTDGDVRS